MIHIINLKKHKICCRTESLKEIQPEIISFESDTRLNVAPDLNSQIGPGPMLESEIMR